MTGVCGFPDEKNESSCQRPTALKVHYVQKFRQGCTLTCSSLTEFFLNQSKCFENFNFNFFIFYSDFYVIYDIGDYGL